jgi:hypothetical protein
MASSETADVGLWVSAAVGSMKVTSGLLEIEFFIDKLSLGAIINV